MSEQIPLPSGVYAGLPELAIDDRALAKFTITMVEQLYEFEQRFAQPRRHAQPTFFEARQSWRPPT